MEMFYGVQLNRQPLKSFESFKLYVFARFRQPSSLVCSHNLLYTTCEKILLENLLHSKMERYSNSHIPQLHSISLSGNIVNDLTINGPDIILIFNMYNYILTFTIAFVYLFMSLHV